MKSYKIENLFVKNFDNVVGLCPFGLLFVLMQAIRLDDSVRDAINNLIVSCFPIRIINGHYYYFI